MEQEFILDNCKSFEPEHIFDCGQCFRWNKEPDGSYTGVFNHNVINVKKENNKIIFKGICSGNIQDECNKYFDLDRDYEKIKDLLINRVTATGQITVIKLTEEQIKVLEDIYENYDNKPQNIAEIQKKYQENLDKYVNLKKISTWWDDTMFNMPSIEITPIGRILAQVNAKRLDDRVPSLEN